MEQNSFANQQSESVHLGALLSLAVEHVASGNVQQARALVRHEFLPLLAAIVQHKVQQLQDTEFRMRDGQNQVEALMQALRHKLINVSHTSPWNLIRELSVFQDAVAAIALFMSSIDARQTIHQSAAVDQAERGARQVEKMAAALKQRQVEDEGLKSDQARSIPAAAVVVGLASTTSALVSSTPKVVAPTVDADSNSDKQKRYKAFAQALTGVSPTKQLLDPLSIPASKQIENKNIVHYTGSDGQSKSMKYMSLKEIYALTDSKRPVAALGDKSTLKLTNG